MEMIIALNSFFRDDQTWPKDHQIWIRKNMLLKSSPHMCRLSRSATSLCRFMKPNRHVFWSSTTCINKRDLHSHLALHQLTHSSLSSSDWFVHLIGQLIFSHVWQEAGQNYRAEISEIFCSLTRVWPALTLTFWALFDLDFQGEFLFQQAAFIGTRTRIFVAVWPALTTGLTFVWLGLTTPNRTVLTAVWPTKAELNALWVSC